MKLLLESPLSERFDIVYLKTNVRGSNVTRGKLDHKLVLAFFRFVCTLVYMVVRRRPKAAYHYVTANRTGWLGRDVWCIWICRVLGVPIVIHMRAGHFRRNFQCMYALERALIRSACKSVTRGLVQAEVLKDQFRGLIHENRIFAVHNSVDTRKFHNPSPLTYDTQKVFFMGHLSHAKGYCDLLKALPELVRRHPGLRLLLAGDKIRVERNVFHDEVNGRPIEFEDPDEVYERYIQGRLERHHVYLGLLQEEEKIRVLKDCNFLVLPSYSEGFSMSVLEALSMGKPVVCSPVGALKTVVLDGENGYFVNPGDVAGLVEKMDMLLSDKQRRNAMALRNMQYARKHFDVEVIAGIIGDHIEAAMGKKSGEP